MNDRVAYLFICIPLHLSPFVLFQGEEGCSDKRNFKSKTKGRGSSGINFNQATLYPTGNEITVKATRRV